LAAGHIQPPFACAIGIVTAISDYSFSPISALIRPISASSSPPMTGSRQRMAAPSGTPRVTALLAPAASMP
jgi:hypothetical protein